jgi:CDP-diacylglycerol---serine O-phosphatidyltransferase
VDETAEPRPQSPAPIPRKKRFQLIRDFALADFITLGNAASGTAAIFLCLNYLDGGDRMWLSLAMFLMPVAFACDALDGTVARWRHKHSPYGADLDSLADTVSFGVAPAVLGFTLGMRGFWDSMILLYFVCCGISRLARFNVTVDTLTTSSGKVAYFEGTPIPTSLAIVAVLAIAFGQAATGPDLWFGSVRILGATLHPLTLLYAISGSLMISTIRLPKP